ncbi:hypothetical protein KM043_011237 [Ampulex compressa]|nr:hypothetical protein KM043_011237 [Ampulex compressa]
MSQRFRGHESALSSSMLAPKCSIVWPRSRKLTRVSRVRRFTNSAVTSGYRDIPCRSPEWLRPLLFTRISGSGIKAYLLPGVAGVVLHLD